MADGFSLTVRGTAEFKALAELSGPGARRASRRAMSQTATFVRKRGIDIIVTGTDVQRPAVSKRVKVIQRPTNRKMRARIRFFDRRIPVARFNPRVSPRSNVVAADVHVQRGIEVIRRAFKPAYKSRKARGDGPRRRYGKRDIYERRSRGGKKVSRYPIKLAVGPSPAFMIVPALRTLMKDTQKELEKRMRVEVTKEFQKLSTGL